MTSACLGNESETPSKDSLAFRSISNINKHQCECAPKYSYQSPRISALYDGGSGMCRTPVVASTYEYDMITLRSRCEHVSSVEKFIQLSRHARVRMPRTCAVKAPGAMPNATSGLAGAPRPVTSRPNANSFNGKEPIGPTPFPGFVIVNPPHAHHHSYAALTLSLSWQTQRFMCQSQHVSYRRE